MYYMYIFLITVKDDKTVVILNGGTTNDNEKTLGTLQLSLITLKGNNINVSEFREPDLNDALTAICFLADERVFNKTYFKDFNSETDDYETWVDFIGGEENVFLRNFLSDKKLL